MASSERDTHEAERARGPGRRLRQTRERRGLGVPEVAGALHLDRRTLQALEADDYGALPPATFVRGYLRAYALHLDLPEEEVLQAFDRLGLNRRRPLSTGVGPLDRHGAGLGLGAPLLMAALAVLVAGGGWLLWSGRISLPGLPSFNGAAPTVVDAAAEQPAPGPVVAAVSEPTRPDAVPRAAPKPEPSSSDQPAVEGDMAAAGSVAPEEARTEPRQRTASRAATSVGAASVGAAYSRDSLTGNDSPASAQASTPEQTETGDAEPVTPEPAAASTGEPAKVEAAGPTEPAPAAEAAAEPLETLSFTFTGESWMEVVDARGERLLFGLVTEAGEREVRGVPPFQIVIGDVGRVSMRREGERVSVDPYTRGRVARFTIGSINQKNAAATGVAAR